jgi:hypothetical protein
MPTADTPDLDHTVAWFVNWPLRSVEFALQVQQMQLEAWRAWQGSLPNWNAPLFDWWACRGAGGVPIDG